MKLHDLFAVRIILDVPVRRKSWFAGRPYSIVTDVHTPERLKTGSPPEIQWLRILSYHRYRAKVLGM